VSNDESRLSSFIIDDVAVDPSQNSVRIGGLEQSLRPQAMDILVHLARRAGEVVSPDDLMDKVWQGRIVTLGSVYNTIAELRSALSQSDTVSIDTIPKRGYKLNGKVVFNGEEPVTAAPAGRQQSMRFRMAGIAAGALLLAATFFIFRELDREPRPTDQSVSTTATALPVPGRDTLSRRARDRYDDGLYYLRSMDPMRDDFEEMAARAIAKFEESIDADPVWALPHAELGDVLQRMRHLENGEEHLHRAEEQVREAIRLDPELGKAYGALAFILAVRGEYGDAAELYEQAIALNADEVHWGKAILLRTIGRHEEAIREFEQAIRNHPSDLVLRFQLFETYYCARRYVETIDGLEEFFFGNDYEPYVGILLANSHARLGNTEEALALAEDLVIKIGDVGPVATVMALTGRDERARAALAETMLVTEPFIVLDMVPAAIVLGERAQAMAMLENAATAVYEDVSLRNDWLWRFQCLPEIQSLEGHPRFEALLRRLGLPSTRSEADLP
jgi:DNA-binding winged helix-turn-helix (wHTH) protein/tetratricopeptide (TPR) repeat protein